MNTTEYSTHLTTERIADVLHGVRTWVEEHNYRGYEPFDGLSSWLRPLALGREFPLRLLQQLIRQSPWNLRPLLGVKPKESTKGRGYMAWGYLLLYRMGGDEVYLERAEKCLKWLDQHKVARFPHHSWSNHFDFVGRGGMYTSADPIIVWTSLIGHAYVEAFEVTGSLWFLRIAESACDWIIDLPREVTPTGNCLSYLSDRQLSIHNANMLGAGLLARTAKHCGNEKYLRVARSAMQYSCTRQRPDGSWWYAEDEQFHWIDNFHTGYNLDSLKCYIESSQDTVLLSHLDKGLKFYIENFFRPDGAPKYYHDRTYPVDIQCASQSIDTLAKLGQDLPICLDLAWKVAAWTIGNMYREESFFCYRLYPFLKVNTPMLHWGQATMFKALAQLMLSIEAASERS